MSRIVEEDKEIMLSLDQIEATLRGLEHMLFAIRKKIGDRHFPPLKVGYFPKEDEPS